MNSLLTVVMKNLRRRRRRKRKGERNEGQLQQSVGRGLGRRRD